MTLFECVQTFITNVPSLAAKVTGVYPGYIPQEGVFPLAVVRYVSGVSEPPTQDGGPSPWSQVRLEFTFWGPDYVSMEQAAGVVMKAFQSAVAIHLGGVGNGVFCPRSIQGPRDVRDEERRATGIQVDILGLLNGDSIA